MSSTRVKRKGEKTVVYMDGQQLQGSGSNIVVSCGCQTTVSMENMDQPQVLRVVPKGTTILVEEVKPPPKAQRSGSGASGRFKHGAVRKGSPTIQIVQECESSADYYPPPSRPEPMAAEQCVECVAELIERRRSGRRGEEDETDVVVTTRVMDEEMPAARGRGGGCNCPNLRRPDVWALK
ncbi:hypothetical protein MTO96_047986 [Rhipicephalus appendiculatus]